MNDLSGLDQNAGLRVGRLKWFSRSKGFGFIECDDLEEDVLLHQNAIGGFGFELLQPDAEIEVLTVKGKNGYKVEAVKSVSVSQSVLQIEKDAEVNALPLVPARVKWYDEVKGFGFANAFKNSNDIFLHKSIVNRLGILELYSGDAICVRYHKTERGLIALDVQQWV